MELIFVSHGQAEHTMNIPASYEIEAPGLTQLGVRQAERLRASLPLTEQDAVIASPTRRTLQTARIWCEGTDALRFAHPTVGPRQFPPRYDFFTYRCDHIMEPRQIKESFSEFLPAPDVPEYIWLQGIHTAPALLFDKWSAGFLAWCGRLERRKVYIVSHEGTISSYIQRLTGTPWRRKQFIDDLDWIPLSV
ncbi:histidine phosphatase family protein [Paenibacillus rigui]|uniref:Histidine phosphatase family protein n=1 Tax=Paenibacillus rigui TaxID=554312 RepID=A0A229UXN1_9BACL|nr:histidine phosphatase family protein [Paenibacillus rigui]OXM88188.1 histidine phosphatase family protein [Paenibacillus rigui]